MSDQKNLIIAIAISVAILLGFQFFIEKPKQDRLREQQATEQAQKAAAQPGLGIKLLKIQPGGTV